MPLGMEVGLSPGDSVRWGPSPPHKFLAHVYYSYCDFVRTLHSRYCFVQVQGGVVCPSVRWSIIPVVTGSSIE